MLCKYQSWTGSAYTDSTETVDCFYNKKSLGVLTFGKDYAFYFHVLHCNIRLLMHFLIKQLFSFTVSSLSECVCAP